MTNIITACFGGTRYANTRPAWLIDHGMVLKIAGVELPDVYEVDFSNSKSETATRVLGGPDGVVIPDQYFLSNAPQIFAWVYLTTGDSGFTTLQITIPLSQRPDVSTEPPTPQETDLIEQAIAALNDGVDRAEAAADILENCTATATTLEPHSEATASYDNGVFTFGIPRGADGSGGGGGGTGDYNDLSNKPSINGNVLSGNQTAAQLGLAAASFFCKARVYEYEILINDVSVAHLVPVKRRSDGVLGMYDLVSQQFRVNAGTGTFVAGTPLGE